jgi:hypothetical protein
MSDTLKPCPFCGGEPIQRKSNRYGIEFVNIGCGNCLYEVSFSVDWNTRTTDDSPDNDSTDVAHPAWWRAHEYTADVFCREVNAILDGKPETGGISTEPWQSLKVRLHQSRTTSALLEKAVKAMEDYGTHLDDCKYSFRSGVECSCGWSKEHAAIHAELTAQKG